MKILNEVVCLSATDLVNHLDCQHLTALDLATAGGQIEMPGRWDPLLEILRERGQRHEAAYVEHLRAQNLEVFAVDGVDITPAAIEETRIAMASGKEVIIQGALQAGRWSGRADILRRVATPSKLGPWSYEVIDTKLARETKAGAVLQLCLYADLLEQEQEVAPEHVHVVAPWSDYEPQTFRFADYAAYYRRAKLAAELATGPNGPPDVYPEPKPHCDVCRWSAQCEQRRHDDDHLCLVAGITKAQIAELQDQGITTTEALSQMPIPLSWKPNRGAPASYEKVREQARIQVESRQKNKLCYELLPVVAETGLAMLPEPSEGDIFFDIEGDPFVGEQGLEYLFGYQYRGKDGDILQSSEWALDRDGEKRIFEQFVDFVVSRREADPDLHVYHFAPYEPGALKRLMGRYASREEQIDDLLRGKVLVDLYRVVRTGLRAGVESYSIKKLEPLYDFSRQIALHEANIGLARVQAGLELGDLNAIDETARGLVSAYNADDCASTMALRDWLEDRRKDLIAAGTAVPRPEPGNEASEELGERQERVNELVERLIADIPPDAELRTAEQQARWILAYLLDWHRRELKAAWWEYFRLKESTAEELLEEKAALGNLELLNVVDRSKTGIPTHRYRYERQDTDLRGDEDLSAVGGDKIGKAVAVSTSDRTIDIRKTRATADIHPAGIYSHTVYKTPEQENALFRIGEYVADHGIEGDGDYLAARALLLREAPRAAGQPLRKEKEETLQAAVRIAGFLEGGILPIQGPPGTGKTYTGAHMICRLVKEGKKIGITANSHKVIRNLIDTVLAVSAATGVELRCVHKTSKDDESNQERLELVYDNPSLFAAVDSGHCQVAGGTHFLWSRADAHDVLDVLVVDEAAQMSLANVIAVSQSARTLILIGDPQQLDQPTQGTHPDGTGVSSLEHILDGHHTIAPDRGLFLAHTWRLHPEICKFNSELFYDGKLHSRKGCEQQKITSKGPVQGTGLRYLPIAHGGNQSASVEEAEAVAKLVKQIMSSNPHWTNRDGTVSPLTLDDIVIIAPYNAQVFEIQDRLPDARVGTVDKFQGQEAPIAIYSTATSSYADAPRGMEFLYSANRLNVAVSRAKCLTVLIASPDVFEAECRTPLQMRLANAFCRYLELAEEISI